MHKIHHYANETNQTKADHQVAQRTPAAFRDKIGDKFNAKIKS